jgi:hypothetical protein
MNRAEASTILNRHLDELEAAGYAALAERVGENQAIQERSPSGIEYQLELTVVWDGKPGGDLRLIASIDDGGWRAFFPLTESRPVRPGPRPAAP